MTQLTVIKQYSEIFFCFLFVCLFVCLLACFLFIYCLFPVYFLFIYWLQFRTHLFLFVFASITFERTAFSFSRGVMLSVVLLV